MRARPSEHERGLARVLRVLEVELRAAEARKPMDLAEVEAAMAKVKSSKVMEQLLENTGLKLRGLLQQRTRK